MTLVCPVCGALGPHPCPYPPLSPMTDDAKGAVQHWVAEYAERMNAPRDACRTVAQYVWTAARNDMRGKLLALCDAMEDGYLDVSDFAIEQIRAVVVP